MSLEAVGGLTVRSCASAEEALGALAEFDPDLVLLDVEMPRVNGPSALEALRNTQRSDEPVVFLTARTEPRQVQRLLGLGAVDIIPKPFDPLDLARRVRTIWDRLSSR